jgi:homoserine kinase
MASVDIDGEIAPDEHGGTSGVFITDRGLKAMLTGFQLEIGDWRLKLQRTAEELAMKTLEANALNAHAKALEWKATWGIPLGLGLGIAGTMIVLGIAVGIFLALPTAVRTQVVQ